MQADAEHEQHHADLGELRCQPGVRHEPRSERPDEHAGEQVAHQRRQAHAGCQEAEHQGQAQAGGNRRDEGQVVVHGSTTLPERQLYFGCSRLSFPDGWRITRTTYQIAMIAKMPVDTGFIHFSMRSYWLSSR
jgi:hypothetical protein